MKLNNNSFRNGVQWAWDSTSISTAMTCPRKYQFMMIEQLEPKVRSVHLIFGGLYATALEHFYKHLASGASIDQATIAVVREALIATWDAEADAPIEFTDNKKTRFNLIRTIVWYIDEFGDEKGSAITTVHKEDGTPCVELSFSFELTDDIVLCGHLDRLVQYAEAYYVMDQKTTGGTISAHYFKQYKPDVQMSVYTYAGQIILQSPVRGVLIDAAQIAVGGTTFKRGFTYRTPSELDEAISDVQHIIEMTQHYTAAGHFPRNMTACNNYGGCPYREICSAPPQARESIKRTEYTSKLWDPIERR